MRTSTQRKRVSRLDATTPTRLRLVLVFQVFGYWKSLTALPLPLTPSPKRICGDIRWQT